MKHTSRSSLTLLSSFKRALCIGTICMLCTGCKDNFDQRLAAEVAAFNQTHYPFEPSPGERLDSTSYHSDSRTYTLWYSLDSLHEAIIKEQGHLMHKALLEELRNEVNHKELKDHGVVFEYRYYSQRTHEELYHVSLRPAEYQSREIGQ